MAQAERHRKLNEEIKTISSDISNIIENLSTKSNESQPSVVDMVTAVVPMSLPVVEYVNKPEEDQNIQQKPQSTIPTQANTEKEIVKILKPIKEEDAPSSICLQTYKSVFKKCHHDLKLNRIGRESKGPFFRSPKTLKPKAKK